jgi:cellulose synthase/poly-beta-1,6-N-acetylglucosamine synthase-like glycosyltransferase
MLATGLVLVLLSPLLLINLVFAIEVLVGLAQVRMPLSSIPAARTAVIVPAHNEALGIASMLTNLQSSVSENFSTLVIADNCTDNTAAIARRLSVNVVERQNLVQRGKGYALDFARDVLRKDPPATVIILDADCLIDGISLQALASTAQQMRRAVQAVYLLEPAPSAPALVQVSSFAFLIKNLVRQRALQRLAGSVHLTGTGMCLPWEQFDVADLATPSIVEDMRLGIELARSGRHPILIEEAVVWSAHADQANTLEQRSRWEGGYLALAGATAPGLIGRGLQTFSARTLFAGLDLLVPPLALLTMLDTVALAAVVLLATFGATSWLPALLLGGIGGLAVVALLLAWWREGRAFLSPAALLRLPLYPLWKIPMYLKLVRSGAPKNWQRTERPGGTDGRASPPPS